MDAATTLRHLRTDAGLTLRGLAERAGTSHSTLAAYESGAKSPSMATFDRIARAAGFRVDASLQRRVAPDEPLSRGDELEAVLRLASEFPARHTPTLEAPIFGR
ncbi:MAG: helix-turn-helix transcriptional regulator [Actinomycetota bacterium]